MAVSLHNKKGKVSRDISIRKRKKRVVLSYISTKRTSEAHTILYEFVVLTDVRDVAC